MVQRDGSAWTRNATHLDGTCRSLLGRSRRRRGRHNGRAADRVQLGKILLEIRTPARADQSLVRAVALRRALAVTRIELIHGVHSVGHQAERSKTLMVEPGVIAEINEQLSRPRVWSGRREGNVSAAVALD